MSATTTHPLITKKDADTLQGIRSSVAQVREASLVMSIPTEGGTVEERTTATTAANEQLGAVKKLLRKIEATRKEVKEPYLEAGRIVDKIAKEELSSPLEQAKKHLEKQLLAEQTKRDEEARIEREKAAEAARKSQEILDKITAFAQRARERIAAAHLAKNVDNPEQGSIDALVSLLSADPHPDWKNEYGQHYEYLISVRETLAKEAQARMISLSMISDATNLDDIDIAQQIEVAQAEDTAEQLEKHTQIAQQQAAMNERVQSREIDAYAKATSTRSTWTYEVVDLAVVPGAYKTVDDTKVKEFIRNNKEHIAAGKCRIAGLKFIEQKTIVSR